MSLRADHKIVERIYRRMGLEYVRRWHSLPFCEVETGPLAAWMIKQEKLGHMELPVWPVWPEAIFSFSCDAGAQYSLLSVGAGDMCEGRAIKWSCQHHMLSPDGTLTTLQYHFHEGRLGEMCGLRGNSDGQNAFPRYGKAAGIVPGIVSAPAVQAGADRLTWALAFLSRDDIYPVESVATMSAGRRRSTSRIKAKYPWLRDDLKKIILIDFKQAERLGWKGGTHATPHPHQRRGHWRTYRDACWGERRGQRCWIRPAWVGDREWVFNGQHYRVIEPEPAAVAAGEVVR